MTSCTFTIGQHEVSYIVDEARFVSSCFSLPSRANPRLSLLFDSNGVR